MMCKPIRSLFQSIQLRTLDGRGGVVEGNVNDIIQSGMRGFDSRLQKLEQAEAGRQQEPAQQQHGGGQRQTVTAAYLEKLKQEEKMEGQEDKAKDAEL